MSVNLSSKERELLAEDDGEARRFGYWMLGVSAVAAAAVLTLGLQAYGWLTSNRWPPFSLSDALHFVGQERTPQIPWETAQTAADWLWASPLWLVLLALALLGMLFAPRRSRKAMPDALSSALRKRAAQSPRH